MKNCKIKNCDKKHLAGGYCHKHYMQKRVHGKILERTRFDKNEIIDCGDYYEICLYSGLSEQKVVAKPKIDKDDYEKINKYKWHLSSYGYAKTNIKTKDRENFGVTSIGMHQLIIGKKTGMDIDHINGDKLDNRRSNLRECTHQQNTMNNKNALGYCWLTRDKRWHAYIGVNNKKISLGNFKNKEEAIIERKKAEKKYFGDFA